MREILINAYLDYINNYLSVEKYAEHHGMTFLQGFYFIEVARAVFNSKHPDA